MTASAILSAPTPMAGATSQPLPEAGAVLPMAAAVFGALVDARTAVTAEAAPAATPADPLMTPIRPAGTLQAAEMLPVAMPETGGTTAPGMDATGDVPVLPPVPGVENQPVAPVPGKPPAAPVQPETGSEAPPLEPVPPLAGQAEPPAQLAPPATTDLPVEGTSPPKEGAADGAEDDTDARAAPAQPVAVPPQAPLPSVSPVQPAAQRAPAAPAQAETDTAEAVPELKRSKAARQAHATATVPVSGGKDSPAGDAARPVVQSAAATVPDVPATADQPDAGLPSPLLTQTMAPVTSRPAAAPYPPAAQAAPQAPVVAAQPGRVGADIGVEIAKAAKGEREDLLIRLDPRDMGRIHVRLSFDGDGMMRAVMSADSPAALDMLRRESGDLNRALADAGIRSDAQSLRFDARSGDQGQGGSHSGQRGQQSQSGGSQGPAGDGAADLADVHYRPLRSSGQVDLMA